MPKAKDLDKRARKKARDVRVGIGAPSLVTAKISNLAKKGKGGKGGKGDKGKKIDLSDAFGLEGLDVLADAEWSELTDAANTAIPFQEEGHIQISGDPTEPEYNQVLQVVADDQDIGGESFTQGDVILGDQTQANVFFDKSTGRLNFRGGTTINVYVDTAGKIFISSGETGGWTLDAVKIVKDTGVDATSAGMAPADYPFYAGATYANRATAPFRVTPAGALTATSATITGTITATAGAIGGWALTATTLASGSITLNSSVPSIAVGAATAYGTGTGVWMGLDAAAYKFRVGDPAGTRFDWNGTALSLSTGALNAAVQRWETDIVFSSTSDTVVSWTLGTIRRQDGSTYSILAGNTGVMAALTYIYLDIAVSVTTLQVTTTYSTAVGDGKILVAAAQNHTAGASVIPFGGQQPIINATDQITALSIVAGNIAAGAITASKISVAQLSAISADMGSITAGTITAATIRTAASPAARVELNSTVLAGYSDATTKQFYLDATTGKAYAGGGNITIDATAVTIANGYTGFIFKDTAGATGGRIVYSALNTYWFINDKLSQDIILSSQITSGSNAYLTWGESGVANRPRLWLYDAEAGLRVTFGNAKGTEGINMFAKGSTSGRTGVIIGATSGTQEPTTGYYFDVRGPSRVSGDSTTYPNLLLDNTVAVVGPQLKVFHTGAPDANSYGGWTFDASAGTKRWTFDVYDGTSTASTTFESTGDLAVHRYVLSDKNALNGAVVTRALFTQTASVTVANTVTQTTLLGAGVGTKTLPANFARVGQTIRLTASGYYSTTGTPTLRFRFFIGTGTCVTAAVTCPSGASNLMWRVDAEATFRTIGATGTIFAQGQARVGISTGDGQLWQMANTATDTRDTTGALAVDLQATWGTASASNTITCSNVTIEVVN